VNYLRNGFWIFYSRKWLRKLGGNKIHCLVAVSLSQRYVIVIFRPHPFFILQISIFFSHYHHLIYRHGISIMILEYLEVLLRLFFKVFFTRKCIKIIYFFIFLKLFLISTHQNDLKTLKNINLK